MKLTMIVLGSLLMLTACSDPDPTEIFRDCSSITEVQLKEMSASFQTCVRETRNISSCKSNLQELYCKPIQKKYLTGGAPSNSPIQAPTQIPTALGAAGSTIPMGD